MEANPVFVNPFFGHGQRQGLSRFVGGPQLTMWRKNAVVGGILSSMVLSLIFTPAIHFYLRPRIAEQA